MNPALPSRPSSKETLAPVSVIIPCWKCENTLGRALDSVNRQTRKPAEVIIVNDASGCATSDALYRVCRLYNQPLDGWIKVLYTPRRSGPAGARNLGWQNASQPLVAFLDADDAWHPRKIEIQYAYMAANPRVALSGHRTIWLKPGMIPPELTSRWRTIRIHPQSQLIANRFHTRSVIARRDLPFRFETAKRYSEDYLLWSEIVLNGFRGEHIALPLAYTFKPQYGGFGLSGDLWEMEKGELDTFFRLYHKHLISLAHLFGLIPFSFAKFVKRKILSTLFYKTQQHI